jgi:hypothetical protein
VNATIDSLRREYTSVFTRFLDEGDEVARRGAYELGRHAVADGVGLLELALVHHEVLVAHLELPRSDASQVAHAGAEFLMEALSAYEMVRRGFGEAIDAMTVERRHAALVRQLSTLLADTSLASHGRGDVEEMLRLVAEQARELTSADWACIEAMFGANGSLSASSASSERDAVPGLPRDTIEPLFETPGRACRLRVSPGGEILAAALTALDGRSIGVLAIGGNDEARLSEVDEAVVVHLAQMAAAALERVTRYA